MTLMNEVVEGDWTAERAEAEAVIRAEEDARMQEQARALEEAEAAAQIDVAERAKALAKDDPIVVSGDRGTRSFHLYQPIKVDGRMLTKVTLRPPTAGDLDDWGTGEVTSAREMMARLTGLHLAVIRGLDTVDLNAIYSMFWDMMPDWVREGMPNENAG